MLLNSEFPHVLIYQAIDNQNEELLDTKETLPKGFVKSLVDKAKLLDEKKPDMMSKLEFESLIKERMKHRMTNTFN